MNEGKRAVERHSTHDRAHRVGQKSNKPRPIDVKFHYYDEHEKVRQTSYNCMDELKAANLENGIQIPKEIREARKPLYPIMKRASDEGKSFNLFCLFV